MGGKRARRVVATVVAAGLTGWLALPALATSGSAVPVAKAAAPALRAAVTQTASSPSPSAAPAHATTQLTGGVLRGIGLLAPTAAAPAGQVLQIGVGLALPDPAGLQAFYQSEYDPASPNYRHFLTPDEFASRFGVPAATYSNVLSWLRSGGLQITQTTPAGDWAAATGTVSQLDRLFGVTIDSYLVKGVSFLANTTAPFVPAGDSIVSVVGLNTLQRFSTPKAPAAAPTPTPTVPGCLPSCVYGPRDLWSMYDMPANNQGQGQTLAIFGEGRTDDVISNLRDFETNFKLPTVPVTVKRVGPGTFSDDSGQLEWDLDTQASTGMAPSVYGVDLYFADSLADASVESLFTAWATDPSGPKQANASFGECETNPTNPVTGSSTVTSLPFGTELGNNLQPVAEQTLQQAAVEGRTLFAAAGDTGSSCPAIVLPVVAAGNGVANQVVPFQNYPCVSDFAVCVGGTVLWSDGAATPQRAIEKAWEFTGGGSAFFQPEPGFQKNVSAVNVPCLVDPTGTPFPSGTICRGAPDVAAMSGDVTDNAYSIYGNGAATTEGGTSLSSPLWVGMWSRIQAAAPALTTVTATKGKSPKHTTTTVSYPGLGFANYPIYRVGQSPAYADDFFDVTLGTNGLYHAATGWDYVSGWGVPDVTKLMQTLDNTTVPVNNVAPPPLPPPPPSACNALWLNTAHTATDTFGNSDPQLTLLEGNMAPSADGKSLVVSLTVADLSASVPTGASGADWYMTWTYNGTEYFAQAQIGPLPGSAPVFSDGTVALVGASHQFQSAHTDTGSLVLGKDGVVQVVVPLANIGNPPVGAVLTQPAGLTYIEIGVPANPTGLGVASLQQVDSGGPTHDYPVGTTTGTSGCTLPQ